MIDIGKWLEGEFLKGLVYITFLCVAYVVSDTLLRLLRRVVQ